jgi:hypothetical protein
MCVLKILQKQSNLGPVVKKNNKIKTREENSEMGTKRINLKKIGPLKR